RTFTVAIGAPPTVTAAGPKSGPTMGGTPIAVFGANFVSGAAVAIGGAAATNVTVGDSTKILVPTPAHAGGVVDVTVTNPNGQHGTRAGAFTYAVLPSNDNFADRFPLVGRGRLTATGSNAAATFEASEPADRFGAPG